MSIYKYSRHEGRINDLSRLHHSFGRLKSLSIIKSDDNRWKDSSTRRISHDFIMAFFGKSGYGKSSTVNALFGRDIMATSDVDSCTRRCDCINYEISPGNYLSLADFPGVGESEYRDTEYLGMYRDFMRHVGVVIYIMRADARDHSIDEKAFKAIFNTIEDQRKVIIGLNQCDKVEPVNRTEIEPTAEQMENIQKKIRFLQQKFRPCNAVVPYSAATGWNMNALADEMVNVAIRSGDFAWHGDNL